MTHGRITVTGLLSSFLLSLLFLAPAGVFSGISMPAFLKPAPAPPPPLAAIASGAELVPTTVHISDILEGSNQHYRIRYSLHGEIMISVDLGKMTYAKVLPEKREVVIRLPAPRVLSARVDHQRSFELSLDWIAWVPTSDPKRLREEVWKRAEEKLEKLAQEPGYKESARRQAEHVLARLFQEAGWKPSFEWADDAPAR